MNLSALTPDKNEVSAESKIIDGCQHVGNNYGIEETNSEEIICGPDANKTAEYTLIATSTSGETIQFTLEVISGDQVVQSYEGSLDPTQPETIIKSKL